MLNKIINHINPHAKLIKKLIIWYNEIDEEVWSDDDPDDIAIDSFYIQVLFRIRKEKTQIIDDRQRRLEQIIRHQKKENDVKNGGVWKQCKISYSHTR